MSEASCVTNEQQRKRRRRYRTKVLYSQLRTSSLATSKALLSISELVPTTPPRPMCLQSTAPARTPATLTMEVEGMDSAESAPTLKTTERFSEECESAKR